MIAKDARWVTNALRALTDESVTFRVEDVEGGCNIIPIEGDLPSDEQIVVKANELELEWQNKQYQRDRMYPKIGEQLDMLYHAIDGDEGLKTQFNDFYTAIKAVKDANPKPAE